MSASSCLREECDAIRTYKYWKPVYELAENFRVPITAESPRELCEPGQLYYYNDYLLIAEKGEGIHLIDNRNPAAPVFTGFLPIKGAQDMAVYNGYLYANNYMDLVVFGLQNPANPQFIKRLEEAFPFEGTYNQGVGYVVAYEETDETVKLPCSDGRSQQVWFWRDQGILIDSNFDLATLANTAESSDNGGSLPTTGIGGSLARFTIAQAHLYVVDDWSLRVFDLATPTSPQKGNNIAIGWGIETIFPYGNHLFIGSQSGMFIFDNSNPKAPQQIGVFEHARACDPVYVSGNRAYVTLRDGTTCQNFINQLDVVDISVLTNPRLIKTHPMHRPIGLSLSDNQLFICEDDQGVKVFDASDDLLIGQRLLAQQSGFTARDVITLPNRKVAIIIGPDGIRQLDYSNINNLQTLSHLSVCP